MRILAVDHNALIPANRALYDLLSRMPGVQLRLMVPNRWFNNYAMLHWETPPAEPGYSIVVDRVLFSSRTHRLFYPGMAAQVKAFKPDILFVNSEPENVPSFQASRIVSNNSSLRFVFTSWRNIDYRQIGFPYKLSFLNSMTETRALMAAAHGIVYNPTAQKIFASLGFPATTVIPPPVDDHLFRPRSSAPRSQNKFRVGYIGRLTPEKGIDVLLRAVAGLNCPWELEIIGQGPEESRLRALAATLAVDASIKWIPGLAHDKVAERMQSMDIVVLPSRTGQVWKEQFGRVLIEAMACGVPVIGSDSGEIPWVVGDAGIITPEGDSDALRKAIEALSGAEMTRRTYIERGLERVRTHFSLISAAKSHFSTFGQVLSHT